MIEKNLINGEWYDTTETIPVYDPATKALLGHVPASSAEDAQRSVDAASEAFVKWSNETADTRANLVDAWYRLINENREELARIMTTEQGKPYVEALGEVDYGNQYVRWYAEEARRIYGETIPASVPGKRLFVEKEPVGVVAAITPWNFPAAMITRKLAPALAAGCTIVLKPSEETPFTALRLVELAEEAGIPKGVINVLTGDAATISGVWQADSRVRKITFTGSTAVGKLIMRQAADTMKKLSLELGGHAPFIVTENADLDKAVEGAMRSKFRNGGQACVATNRFYVQASVLNEFTEKFTAAVKQLQVGNGMDADSTVGPLINAKAVAKVKAHIDDAVAKGATILTGGTIDESVGYFVTPTVLANVTEDMLCMQEETFGPLAPISVFETLDEVIERANNTPYGLAAYAFSERIDEALMLGKRLEYGIVGLNDGAPSAAQAPFGGYKESGLGREGGVYGIEDYLEVKYLSLG
ncbi:NAD-dependent succinate-semialdehyde dehydrogenase [Exiguobacterium sp. Leaf187]|uniref:NAD-dependent succinate-semialdehyde dehydrogenase n=1 Tax=Exiguobacterium indicum TaxID=296995 RepID=A0ABU8EEE7_9BACL|nr:MULTISPECIES: NAD-dependent succinate-semialdehyde dehydrogenase [Exiguobacterium]AHA29885.1 succinate-semialdehyde dehdyrogenase [Exiguobacterium sp. MH3]KQS19047.1 NAD-dependent succinate-semialdehyde dehydrogenase [Exiguobacterium sp. Leaf187]NTY09684.1 NAD-dependent succinate-semialdehyde dehydrogenase [Exiguobacterium sp. JMULE1]